MTSQADAADRRLRALQLLVEGKSWPEIAAETGTTAKQAAGDVKRALREAQILLTGNDKQAQKDLMRLLELARLDRWEAAAERILVAAQADGERLDQLRAIDRLLRISGRRDQLLDLADTAEVPPSPDADEVDELAARREDRMRSLPGAQQS